MSPSNCGLFVSVTRNRPESPWSVDLLEARWVTNFCTATKESNSDLGSGIWRGFVESSRTRRGRYPGSVCRVRLGTTPLPSQPAEQQSHRSHEWRCAPRIPPTHFHGAGRRWTRVPSTATMAAMRIVGKHGGHRLNTKRLSICQEDRSWRIISAAPPSPALSVVSYTVGPCASHLCLSF